MAHALEALVAGDDGWISDESSFYGDDETKNQLEESLAINATPDKFWQIQPSLPANVAYRSRAAIATTSPGHRQFWPNDGDMNFYQSTETVTEFVRRLPPSKCTVLENGPWIWILNPVVDTTASSPDLNALTISGRKLLDGLQDGKRKVGTESKPTSAPNEQLADGLKQVAVNANCVSGKWMLFVGEQNVDEVWRIVAEAVANNKLGIGAKVATASADNGDRSRLICIYTYDFRDVKDVKRVLEMLVKLDLAGTNSASRSIFYKLDAYTHLGIQGKNPWGLRASTYASRDILGKQ